MVVDKEDHKELPTHGSLKARLRALPKPPIPQRLEAKLLASIPAWRSDAESTSPMFWRWKTAGLGVAAAVLLFLFVVSYVWKPESLPVQKSMPLTVDDLEQVIGREMVAARLMTSAQILSRQPGGEHHAARLRQYVAHMYPDTSAAGQTINAAPCKSGKENTL